MSSGGEDGVGGVALRMGEEVSAHSALGLQMADDRFDGGAAAQFAFDLLGDASPLARDEDPELAPLWGVVAAIAAVGDDAPYRRADLPLHVGQHHGQRVAVARIARRRLHMRDELAALRPMQLRRHQYFDAELLGAMSLALADAFDLGRMQRGACSE